MSRLKLLLSILYLIVVAAAFVPVARATEDGTDSKPSMQRGAKPMESTRPKLLDSSRSGMQKEVKREMKTEAQDVAARCEMARTAITKQMARFDSVKDEHHTRFSKFTTRLDTVVQKLEDKNVDTTKLVADKETLNGLILEYDSALELYLQKIDAAKALAPNCGTSQGEFLSALKDARTQMQVVRTKSQAVRSFIMTTIKGDLATIKRTAKSL